MIMPVVANDHEFNYFKQFDKHIERTEIHSMDQI